jgi:hypothetical protein
MNKQTERLLLALEGTKPTPFIAHPGFGPIIRRKGFLYIKENFLPQTDGEQDLIEAAEPLFGRPTAQEHQRFRKALYATYLASDFTEDELHPFFSRTCPPLRSEDMSKTATRPSITAQFSDLLNHPSLRPVESTARIGVRLVALGFGVTCNRCGGTGHYSFNSIDGSVCYGCRGAKQKAPKLTAALRNRVQVAVGEGALNTYAARIVEEARLRQLAKGVRAEISEAEAATAWREFHYGRKLPLNEHFDNFSYTLHGWITRIEEYASDLTARMVGVRFTSEERNAAARELVGRLPEFIQRIEILDGLFVRSQAEGITDRHRLAGHAAKATGSYLAQMNASKAACVEADAACIAEYRAHGLSVDLKGDP